MRDGRLSGLVDSGLAIFPCLQIAAIKLVSKMLKQTGLKSMPPGGQDNFLAQSLTGSPAALRD